MTLPIISFNFSWSTDPTSSHDSVLFPGVSSVLPNTVSGHLRTVIDCIKKGNASAFPMALRYVMSNFLYSEKST